MTMDPTPRDYETAELDWNEQHNVGFDELDTFDQYVLAQSIAKGRKTCEERAER